MSFLHMSSAHGECLLRRSKNTEELVGCPWKVVTTSGGWSQPVDQTAVDRGWCHRTRARHNAVQRALYILGDSTCSPTSFSQESSSAGSYDCSIVEVEQIGDQKFFSQVA